MGSGIDDFHVTPSHLTRCRHNDHHRCRHHLAVLVLVRPVLFSIRQCCTTTPPPPPPTPFSSRKYYVQYVQFYIFSAVFHFACKMGYIHMDIGLIGLRWFTLFRCITIEYSEKSCDPEKKKVWSFVFIRSCYCCLLIVGAKSHIIGSLFITIFMRNGNIVCVKAN